MDFRLSEEQVAVRDLAEQIFQGSVSVETVRSVEASEERVDRDLWRALADANLLGIALPEDAGGSGLGEVEWCLLLEQQGRVVAPVPIWATIVLGALPIAEFGSRQQRDAWLPAVVAGDVLLTAALAEPGVNDVFRPQVRAARTEAGWRLDGLKVSVPYAHVATRVLVPAALDDEGAIGVFLVDPAGAGVEQERAVTTNREVHPHLRFAGAPGEPLGGDAPAGAEAVAWMLDRALLGLAALQVGVCEEALRYAAEYTSQRVQFGKPLSAFQGVALKAADAYIDAEAIRVTVLQAAWKLSVGRPATTDVLVAKWWASEGGQHAVHITQHLHGGMGADVDYPVHRYFLWGKQIEDMLGGASATLARLGDAIATSEAHT
ncbi:MAG TPA: acyl-CoA dehydrogenase family protein [Acidimicrobiia bacterium]|nr:acyl-CoA dehydrogenase family protein [Acidimicrobiia bacterium]